MRTFLVAVVLIAASPAIAQFIGFTSPQTVQQRLGSQPNTCGGPGPTGLTVTQVYDVQNLGQTEHFLTVVSDGNATVMTVTITGIDVNLNRVGISDQLEMAGAVDGSLFASGYYPKIQVAVACEPITSTYTLTYSGAWGTPPATDGNFLQGKIDKEIFNGISGTNPPQAVRAHALVPPFGSTAGELLFRFSSAAAVGTITLQCVSFGRIIAPINVFTSAVASTANLQTFPIPNFPCASLGLIYTSGSSAPISVSYWFATPGFSNWPLAAGTPAGASARPARKTPPKKVVR